MPDSITPTLSVCMITYNHEKYIARAIESVLKQQTDFKYELVIGEDCSTDNTRNIVQSYHTRCPDKIRLNLPEHNQGMIPNFIATLAECKGKYIALCEGDDYWTDSYKLQKQVDFLETHSNYVLVGSNAISVREDENFLKARLIHDFAESFDVDTAYLMEKNPFPTLTTCFRNNLIKEFPEIYFSGMGGDRRLYLLLSQYGKCRYISDVVGVYRVHRTGATHIFSQGVAGQMARYKEQIKNARNWNRYFKNAYISQERLVVDKNAFALVRLCLKTGHLQEAINYVRYVDIVSGNYPWYWKFVFQVLMRLSLFVSRNRDI